MRTCINANAKRFHKLRNSFLPNVPQLDCLSQLMSCADPTPYASKRTPRNSEGRKGSRMLSSTIPISLIDSAPIPVFGCKRLQTHSRSGEADIVTRAQAGDHDAFSELYLAEQAARFLNLHAHGT